MCIDYLPEFQKYNFFRPVDWRWRIASLQDGIQSGDSGDSQIKDLASYYQGMRNKKLDDGAFEKMWPGLLQAHRIHEAQGEIRSELEARILGGQSDAEIGKLMKLPPATIQWFEAAFFCVRDRLTARDWIVAKAIGRPHSGLGKDRLPMILKAVAYFGGIRVLDVILPIIQGKPLPLVLTGGDPRKETSIRASANQFLAVQMSDPPNALKKSTKQRRRKSQHSDGVLDQGELQKMEVMADFLDIAQHPRRPKKRKGKEDRSEPLPGQKMQSNRNSQKSAEGSPSSLDEPSLDADPGDALDGNHDVRT